MIPVYPSFLKASAEGIQGNFSGDLLQSGGMLVVAKGNFKIPYRLCSKIHKVSQLVFKTLNGPPVVVMQVT